jgi:hypothetical protein
MYKEISLILYSYINDCALLYFLISVPSKLFRANIFHTVLFHLSKKHLDESDDWAKEKNT